MRLNEFFGTTYTQPFAGLAILAVSDFFPEPPVGGRAVYAEYKNNCQNFNSLWKLFKMFELSEVIRQRGDSQVIDLLNNLRTANLNSHSINLIQTRIIQPEDTSCPKDVLHIYAENANSSSNNHAM